MPRPPPISTLFPYTTLFRSHRALLPLDEVDFGADGFAAWIEPYRSEVAAGEAVELVVTDPRGEPRSEEHTSELQSLTNLVCRLLLEKKKKKHTIIYNLNNIL